MCGQTRFQVEIASSQRVCHDVPLITDGDCLAENDNIIWGDCCALSGTKRAQTVASAYWAHHSLDRTWSLSLSFSSLFLSPFSLLLEWSTWLDHCSSLPCLFAHHFLQGASVTIIFTNDIDQATGIFRNVIFGHSPMPNASRTVFICIFFVLNLIEPLLWDAIKPWSPCCWKDDWKDNRWLARMSCPASLWWQSSDWQSLCPH